MHIGFLGPLRVDGDTSIRPRTRTVLAALGVERGEVVSPAQLAQAVWGDDPPTSWPKQVQICVWDLRRMLGAGVVQTTDGGYRLAVGQELDVEYFESLLGRAHELAAIGQPERAASTLCAALDLWRGRPFEDLGDWAPGKIEVARLEELRRTAQEDLIEARLAAGEHRDVVAEAEARVAEEPLRERRWALLALAQYRSGNQGESLRTLRRARQTLITELGLDPGSELVALETAILGQDAALLAGEHAVGSAHCPYQGLAAYDIDDTDAFFGRDADVTACLNRLDQVRMLVLAGPSGCGKSSLARAGVASALRRRGSTVVVVVPGADPDTALSTALASTPGDAVLVVDQMEEVFAGPRPPADVRAFCIRLADHAVERGQVIITIRADHLGDLGIEPGLARLVEEGLYLVVPLRGPELRATIEGPAAAAGLRLEPGLVELLVREAEDEPGALPLLSHALVQTWERRDGRVLTVDGYLAAGEIHGAVARSAEQLYQSLPADEQARLRALMLRLVVPSGTGAPIRAHLNVSGLPVAGGIDRTLELLVRARLVTAGDNEVQLAHEAVAAAWPRLRTWVDEDAAGLRLVQHLSRSAAEWDSLGRPGSELYRGARLAAAAEWRTRSAPQLTATEAAFLDASIAEEETEHRALAQEAERQARQNRRLRRALGGVAVLLVLTLVAGAVAIGQRQQAQTERREASITALTSEASSLRNSRRDLAALLAVEAHRLRPDSSSEAALFGTFTASPGVERIVHTGFPLVLTVGNAEYLPDGTTVAIGDAYGSVHLQDMSTGEISALPRLSDRAGWPVFDVAADGRYIAAAWRPAFEPETGVVTVWDLVTGAQRFPPVTVDFRIGDIAIAADGSTLAVSGGEQGRVQIRDSSTGALRAELPTLGRPDDALNVVVTAALEFLPNGRLLVGSQAGPIRVIDPASRAEVDRIKAAQATSDGYILSADGGRTIIAGGYRSTASFDLVTGAQRWKVDQMSCNTTTIAERTGVLLCGEWSGRVTAFDLATGVEVGRRFDSQLGSVCAVAVNPAGDRFVEVSGCQAGDVTLVEWRLDGGGPVSRLLEKTPGSTYIQGFDRNDLVAEYPDKQGDPAVTRRIDPQTGKTATFPGVFGLLPTDDPDIAVAIYDDGKAPAGLGLYNLSRRAPAGPVINPGDSPDGVWSNGREVVAACCWDRPQKTQTFDLHSGERTAWAYPDDELSSDMVLVGDQAYVSWMTQNNLGGYTIQRRDVRTGEVTATSPGGFSRVGANGGRVIASTVDGVITELDPDSLQPTGPPFPGTNGSMDMLAIDAAGQRLLALAGDRTLRLYDIPTRTPLGDPIDRRTGEGNAALRGDGLLAAVVTDAGVVTWDLDPAHWETGACELAGRNLTRDEWDRYIGDLAPYSATCPHYPAG